MNVLRPLVEAMNESNGDYFSPLSFVSSIRTVHDLAEKTEQETIGFAKVACREDIFIPPESAITVMAKTSGLSSSKFAIVEPLRASDQLPVGILMASTLVKLGSTFPVRIDNISTSGFTLRPKTRIGIVRGVESIVDESPQVQFQVSVDHILISRVDKNTTTAASQTHLPIDLEEFSGSPEELIEINKLLNKHREIFAHHDFD